MKMKRLQALLLAVILVLSTAVSPDYVLADGTDQATGLCPHHEEHTGCSYQEGSEGSPCSHKHDAECGYQEAKAEVPCDQECTDTDGDGVINHIKRCAYQPAVEGHECGHRHDAACGYEEPVPSVPCDFVCAICDCTCTSQCSEEAGNPDCPVCEDNPADCTFTAVDVSLTFDKDYAEYGKDGGANLVISASISGKKVTEAQVSVSLTDEEAAMLNVSEIQNVSLEKNQLKFILNNDENSGKVSFAASIPVRAESLSSLEISKEDISVSVLPEQYQASPLVNLNLTGDKLTFVEKLPEDSEYGSGTAYAAQVEDVTVHFVDSEGKAAPRQETAPVFTLYYQIEGEEPAALQEGNLPFGLDEIPEISAEAGEDTWTGCVKDAGALPSTVLVLEDGVYVEKEVNWFLQPSYPKDYYENAGTLVEITDANAGSYPEGLGRGWYFIGGQEPFPDDTVTVTEYVSSLKHDIYWADNGDAEGKRPDKLDGLYELTFALDGSSDYQTLTAENMTQLGLDSIPEPTTDSLSGGMWQAEWKNSLPGKVTYSDSTGSGASITRDVSWRVVFGHTLENYACVEITPENAGDYSSVRNQYGTYYVLETALTFRARIYQGNEDYAIEDIREAFLEQFYLDASYTGDKHQYFQLAAVQEDGHYKPEENPDDPTLITVTVTNLWRYNLDNTRINYSIREGNSADDVDSKLNGVSGLDEGDYFAVSYNNSAVPSFSSETTAVYSGGILKLTLTGTIEYNATKVWLDDGGKERPTATMELWRYRSGQSYTTASLVRDKNGEPYTLELSDSNKNADGTYSIDFTDNLPKYDPEGYRYRYVVREYLSGTNAGQYEQVFGTVAEDGTVTDTLPEYAPRDANDTFLYNGGTLSNRLKGTVPVSVTKDWKAASFQSEFEDVMVVMRLQSRMKGTEAKWEDTAYTYQMSGFMAENLTATHIGNYPRYDALGRELEYRWIEEAVWQGGTVENGVYTGGAQVPSSEKADGSRTFTLQQNGREVIYTSTCDTVNENIQGNDTLITNSIANVIDYDVKKEFTPGWDGAAESYTFSLFRASSGSELERYATFTIDGDTGNEPPEITKHIQDGASLSIDQTEKWHVVIHGLPEFDADGQQYEYVLMEASGTLSSITTDRDEKGNYKSVVVNGPGSGNIILVRKEWVDESDSQHRLPVEITVYDRETDEQIGDVVLGTDTWYALVGIGSHEPDEVYIRETKVGDTEVPGKEEGKSVIFSTQYHDYEAVYSHEEDFGASGSGDGAYEGMHCYTVTNRRLGSINLTVTKNWLDGDGTKRKELETALNKENLGLAVKLEFLSEPSLGLDKVYKITNTGYGNDVEGDTVTISEGNHTAIQDNAGHPVDSIQLLELDQKEQTLYFYNLPKYDGNGASVRYTVKEIIVDADGNEVTDLTKYENVAEAWQEYAKSTEKGPYVVGENHALDTQEFTLTNKLNDTTDESWYTLWLDNYAYQEGSRPDIYLNIYARIHNEDGSTQTQLVIRNYRWEFEGDDSNPDITHQNFWKCTIENLPKYDSLGYEIDYFAVMDSVVSAGDFDYLPTSYAPGTAEDSSGIFATADGALEGAAEHLDQIVNVSGDSGGASYALMSGNTFVNIIYDTVTFSGEKLWTNLPDEYPLADLPSVTFTLSRSTEGGSEESNIASMTIDGEDWQNLNVNGHYVFVFGHTGENKPASSFNEDVVPSGASLLPRFDDKGRLYTYTLEETIDWTDTDAEEAEETDGIFASSSSGQTFTNRYQDSCIYHSIRIKKLLRVPAGQKVYPAFGFKLTRTYTTDEGEPSAPEFVMRTSYNADEVKSRVEVAAGNVAQGQTVTAEFTVWFSDLAVYAPNGSKYTYTVTEENTSELGGFDTWVAKGDYSNSKWDWVIREGKKSSEFTGLVPSQHIDDQSDVTFLNETQENPDPIQLTGKKIWKDLDDSFRPDVTKGLKITLERRANAQTGQNNAIDWEKVDIETGGITITWAEDTENEDSWTYTITGLERYAPNGMPWIYQVKEEPVEYYTAGGKGVASQKKQDSDTITMNDLTNTMYTSTSFKKTWVDSDGRTVTENLLGSGIELEVSYELQVRVKEEAGSGDNQWSAWQKAQVYFSNFNELAGRTYSGSIRGALGAAAWNQSYRGTNDSFNQLPTYVKDSKYTIYKLEYRVVETEVKVWRDEQVLLTQTYTAPVDNGDDDYAYTISGGAGGDSLFAPYYGAGKNEQPNSTTIHKNQISTVNITAAKEWRGDHNEVYKTRPVTDADRYDWEVTLAVLRSTDEGTQWDPTPVKTVTLYGSNEEDRKEATVSGLPAFVFDTEGKLQACAYSVRELQSEEAAGGAADREQLKNGQTFNESYTVSYSDDGLTAVNTLNSTEFQGEKVWNDEEETHGDITLELKYLKTGGNPEDPAAYESFVPAAEVQLGEGKAQTNPGSLLYYAEEDWTAVWTEVPLRLADSEKDNDGNTIYRIFETETAGYIAESTAEDGTTTITNTPSVTPGVTKHWLGVPAAQNVTVTLYRKTAVNTAKEEAATAVLTADKNWSHTFEPQPKYDDHGDAYEYWVEETLIDGQDAAEAAGNGGYAVSCGGDAESGFHIYNYKVDTVYVIKDWADVSDAENRPEELQLTLQRTTSTDPKESDWQTVTDVSYTWNKKGDRWETSFAGLPQYDTESGLAYTYRVKETVPAGYEQTILSSKDGIFHFKNTRSELIDIPVEKVWDDNGDKLGYRPDMIRVELYANGRPTGKILELKPGIFQGIWNSLTGSSDGWSGVFKEQPRYDDTGRQIVYSVVETQAPEHYQISYSQKQDGTQVVTNTCKSESSGNSGNSGSSGASVENPPQTGDETNLSLWIILCCAGILGFIVAYFVKKRWK